MFRRIRKVSCLVALIALLAVSTTAVMAQEGEQLTINQIDGRGWPDIMLNLTLTGPDGNAIPGVEVSQFEVTEGDQVQSVTGLELGPARDVPISVVLVIDISGSMDGEKLAQAKAAAVSFLTSLGTQDRAALLSFNTEVTPVVLMTGDKAALENGINGLVSGGDTAAYDALYSAAEVIETAPAGSRRAIILLTDGADTASTYSARVASDVAKQSNALVYTIGLGPDANDTVLTGMSEPTGGKYYKAPTGTDLQGIYSAISIELSSQLLLKYNSTTRVERPYQLVTLVVKYTSKTGQVIVKTIRYRPSALAVIPSTPEVSEVPTRISVPLPAGITAPAEAPAATGAASSAQTISFIGVLGSLLAVLAVAALTGAFGVVLSPTTAAKRLAVYTGALPGAAALQTAKQPGFASRAMVPVINSLGKRIAKLSPKGYTDHIQQQLILMGPPYRLQVPSFLGIQVGLVMVLALPMIWWAIRTSPNAPAQWVLAGILAVAMGIYFPYFWLIGKVRARQRAVLKSMPGALDFLAINVEAGMGFDAALGEIVRRWRNPLTDEFALLLIDFQIGKPRKDAWRELVQRTQVTDLSAFVTAMLQNEQVGSSIGQLLRTQAEYMRIRRRQRAEESARVAPVKMLIPLVFFVFPGILVVLLGPAIPQVLETFGR